jgi:hypothetical protein
MKNKVELVLEELIKEFLKESAPISIINFQLKRLMSFMMVLNLRAKNTILI